MSFSVRSAQPSLESSGDEDAMMESAESTQSLHDREKRVGREKRMGSEDKQEEL